jgi:hypothetical protein
MTQLAVIGLQAVLSMTIYTIGANALLVYGTIITDPLIVRIPYVTAPTAPLLFIAISHVVVTDRAVLLYALVVLMRKYHRTALRAEQNADRLLALLIRGVPDYADYTQNYYDDKRKYSYDLLSHNPLSVFLVLDLR